MKTKRVMLPGIAMLGIMLCISGCSSATKNHLKKDINNTAKGVDNAFTH